MSSAQNCCIYSYTVLAGLFFSFLYTAAAKDSNSESLELSQPDVDDCLVDINFIATLVRGFKIYTTWIFEIIVIYT